MLITTTLGNLNWCRERFSATDVRTQPEFFHYTVFDPGYGFLTEDTPEVSLWVREDWRGQGVGRVLLRRAQDDARARGVFRHSLSVEADNYAKKLYTAEGFVDVPGRGADGVMVWSP